MLQEIAPQLVAEGSKLEVYLDGGVRTGTESSKHVPAEPARCSSERLWHFHLMLEARLLLPAAYKYFAMNSKMP